MELRLDESTMSLLLEQDDKRPVSRTDQANIHLQDSHYLYYVLLSLELYRQTKSTR